MRPPSSCPTGNRLSAVTKSPTQPARATGWTNTSMPGGIDPKTSQVSARISSESPKVSPVWAGSTMPTRDRDVEERVAVARGRAHADHRPHGAEEEDRRRGRDEVGQAHRGAVVAGGEVVAELVGAEDREQGERDRDAVEQPERLQGGVEGHEWERAAHQAARGQGGEHGER